LNPHSEIKMNSKNKVLILSYYACMPGACQAEWLDDKIDSLLKGGYEVALVSAICARRHENKNIKHWRIPSVSLTDYRDELERIRMRGDRVNASTYLMLPVVFTVGLLLDAIQYIMIKGVGEGRWSWTLPSAIGALMLALRFKPNIILSTGGPASAHLAGIAVSKLIVLPVVIELQDPLSGGDIGRNKQARGWLYRVEKLIVAAADKTVYVTKAAAAFAASQFKSSKVFCVYPGAKDFAIVPGPRKINTNGKLRVIHLGSLYATRNFRSIIAAIDCLIESGKLKSSGVELINLGHVAKDISEEILLKPYVKILPPVSREEALRIAADCDVTLLIQNSDERSKVTIPYKTYDYLNLGNGMLALLNSDELTELLTRCGHIAAPLSDIDAIARRLAILLERSAARVNPKVVFDAVLQARELLALPNKATTNLPT
jgi:hypothetical protein